MPLRPGHGPPVTGAFFRVSRSRGPAAGRQHDETAPIGATCNRLAYRRAQAALTWPGPAGTPQPRAGNAGLARFGALLT
ncbi:hypothetical protein BLAT2472_10415 [Burkholderia latens]